MDARENQRHYSEKLDQSLQDAIARFTNGISPAALMLAFSDWLSHLSIHPAKQMELTDLMQKYVACMSRHHSEGTHEPCEDFCVHTLENDKRFTAQSWQAYPYNIYYESFLFTQQWWHAAATNVRGVSQHHQNVVDFTIRQILDMVSPSNSAFTNPEVQQAAASQHGENFVVGMQNFLDDLRRFRENEPPFGAENYIVGENIAVTPGKVIYRNRLIELIQYSPMTTEVYAEPVLITPAWIMKYYILDLTPKHSLVKYLVKKGHTVFMISWLNPKKKDRNLSMDDYLNLGIMSALDVVSEIVPKKKNSLGRLLSRWHAGSDGRSKNGARWR